VPLQLELECGGHLEGLVAGSGEHSDPVKGDKFVEHDVGFSSKELVTYTVPGLLIGSYLFFLLCLKCHLHNDLVC